MSGTAQNITRTIRRRVLGLGAGAIMILTALLAGLLPNPGGAAGMVSEYEVKAAYIYHFLSFVKWPGEEAGASEMVIGILGDDPFGRAFAPINGKAMPGGGAVVRVRRLGHWSPGMDLSGNHVMFISESEQKNLPAILASLSGRPVLTVGDSERFLERGGMINLITVDRRVRWEINRRPAARARLELNSQIFRLAIRVVDI